MDDFIQENDELSMSKKHTPKQDDKEKTCEAEEALESHEVIPSEAMVENSPEEKLKAELSEAKDRYLRLAAEFDNFKKIAIRESQNSVRFANENLILQLLPIIDNLEQAILLGKKVDESKNDILVGVEMVLKQLFETLTKFGVEIFSAKNATFDPSRHEAVSELENDTVTPGTVVVEYQRGYLLNGRLLRPARVAVAKKLGT